MTSTQGTLEFTPPIYFTVHDAANYLHVSVSTVYKLTRERRIKYIKPGKEIMFKKEFLDEYLESRVFDIIPLKEEMSRHVRLHS